MAVFRIEYERKFWYSVIKRSFCNSKQNVLYETSKRAGDIMNDDQEIKKPVIDWHQVFVCNGWDMDIINDIINSDSLETEHKIEEL